MKSDELQQLAGVSDALYRREQAAIRDILAEEARLRAALARIDAAGASLRTAPAGPGDVVLLSGADMAWRQWAQTRKSEFNSDLARVLARKAHATARMRQAFGRNEAVRLLMARAGGAASD